MNKTVREAFNLWFLGVTEPSYQDTFDAGYQAGLSAAAKRVREDTYTSPTKVYHVQHNELTEKLAQDIEALK